MPRRKKTLFSLVFLFSLLVVTSCGSENGTSDEASSDPIVSEKEGSTLGMATVRGKVLTDAGELVTAGIIVEDEEGNTHRVNTSLYSGYNLRLNPGTYKLHYVRGYEYSVVTKTITVEAYKTYYLQDVRLIQLEDSYAKGWVRGDLHQHSYHSDGLNSVHDVLISNISNDLYFSFLTDHNTGHGLPEWVQGNRVVANIDANGQERLFNAYEGVEVTTEFGHYNALGLGLIFDLYEVTLRDVERNKPQAEKDDIIRERIRYIGDTIRWMGAVAQINHPYSISHMGFPYWDVIDSFDVVEIWNGYFLPSDGRYEPEQTSYQGQNYRSKLHWFETLNEVKNGGHYLAATAGTDNHDISGPYRHDPNFDETNIKDLADYDKLFLKYGKYTGTPSTVVKIDGKVTEEKVLESIRKGHSFLTNGPMIYADIAGKSYGETLVTAADNAIANIELFARDGFEELRIIKNGEVIETIATNDESRLTTPVELTDIEADDWFIFEVFGHGVQYAISNPIFIASP